LADFLIYSDDEEIDANALANALKNEVVSDKTLSAEIVIVGEEEIKNLNAQTRGIDAVTDVLSFPNLDDIRGIEIKSENFPYDLDEEGNLFLGSIIICEQRAKEQAIEYGHSIKREKYYLAVHGMCHLLGYDHMNDTDKAQMREKEERILKILGAER